MVLCMYGNEKRCGRDGGQSTGMKNGAAFGVAGRRFFGCLLSACVVSGSENDRPSGARLASPLALLL